MDCSTPDLPVYHQLPELAQTHVYRVGDAIQASFSSLIPVSSYLQSFPASGSFPMSQFFASGGQGIRVSASTSVLPIFRMFSFSIDWFGIDWFDLLTVQGTLKSLLQHHSSKASILRCSASFYSSVVLHCFCWLCKKTHTHRKSNLDRIKKQRPYFADKGPNSQSFGFSSSHVWMWALDHKEGWARKNWCFWNVVLEKTLERPLEGDQPS